MGAALLNGVVRDLDERREQATRITEGKGLLRQREQQVQRP